MHQRDLLKDQIEQISKVLGQILAAFLGGKSPNSLSVDIEHINEQLKSELDIDIEKILKLNGAELKSYLQERKLTRAHIEMLSDYLSALGKGKEQAYSTSGKTYFSKALELLDIADEVSKTLSFDRVKKKDELKKLI